MAGRGTAGSDQTDPGDFDLVMDVMVGEPGEKPFNVFSAAPWARWELTSLAPWNAVATR